MREITQMFSDELFQDKLLLTTYLRCTSVNHKQLYTYSTCATLMLVHVMRNDNCTRLNWSKVVTINGKELHILNSLCNERVITMECSR